jgi:hypothetical protein
MQVEPSRAVGAATFFQYRGQRSINRQYMVNVLFGKAFEAGDQVVGYMHEAAVNSFQATSHL